MTGGKDGTDDSVSLPPWTFSYFDGKGFQSSPVPFSNNLAIGKYSLWDYFGLPLVPDKYHQIVISNHINCFSQRSYNLVWNEFYRDENLCDEVSPLNSTVLYRAWKKDYFTSALPWQQRGVSPALPISGTLPVSFVNPFDLSSFKLGKDSSTAITLKAGNVDSAHQYQSIGYDSYGSTPTFAAGSELPFARANLNGSATVNLADGTTFDVAVLREAFQIQRWLELNARAGVRYTEFLNAHFGIAPRDEVLQRPEYLGGTKSEIVVSEVLQTSATSDASPQGNLAGHGLGAMSDFICSYTAKEFGYIIGIASWMPKPSYQQGVNRIFSRRTKYDFYFPEFAHLSEQAVTKGEIYATGDEVHDNSIFGYQSAYAEMRYMPSINCSDMRDKYSYWHLGRIFGSDPSLNAGFLTTNSAFSGGIRKDIFAVQNEPGLIVNFANIVEAVRPLPVYGTPGFIDHVGRM